MTKSQAQDLRVRTTVRMPSVLKSWVIARASERGISENAHIVTILEEKMTAEAQSPNFASAV